MKPPTEFDQDEHDDAEDEIGQWEAISLGLAGLILFAVLLLIGAAALVFVP